jgi:hypothetical protein
MIDSGYLTDAIGLGTAVVIWAVQKKMVKSATIAHGAD